MQRELFEYAPPRVTPRLCRVRHRKSLQGSSVVRQAAIYGDSFHGLAARTLTKVFSGKGDPRNSTTPLRTTPFTSRAGVAVDAADAGAARFVPRSIARFAKIGRASCRARV